MGKIEGIKGNLEEIPSNMIDKDKLIKWLENKIMEYRAQSSISMMSYYVSMVYEDVLKYVKNKDYEKETEKQAQWRSADCGQRRV